MIEVANLRKRYRRRNVLNGVSFAVEKGQIACLIGLNGAGKSTVLKAIMGLTPVQEGTIRIDGRPVGKETYEKVSYIPDRLTVPPYMKLWEGLRFMQDFYRSWNPERARELMAFFGLDAQERVGNLSKGTAAKFNLVLGLAPDSDYVLMDEPFSGIDLFSRENLAGIFSSGLIGSRGVLLTTHEVDEIERLIDKAILLRGGTVVRSFDCERVRDEEGKSVVDVMREVLLA
ncbi:ABC transporter ATP-binding protein [Cohnella thermotolerans]|uniref:ABC transporter ATP-binding protein n=1 Tax=Cohnella thermotolerans TaxID=329858 RepID=UPI0004286D92|nr:ABC transporter ATP-binding protein [Cohnella thermotolerans]